MATPPINHFPTALVSITKWIKSHKGEVDSVRSAGLRCLDWLVAHREKGSWLWTIPPIILGGFEVIHQFPLQHAHALLNVFTPPVLLGIMWLAAASHMIKSALWRASSFESHARIILGDRLLRVADADHLRAKIINPRGYLFASFCFLLPLTICMCILQTSQDCTLSILYPIVLLPIFYYAGFGIWGSLIISNAIFGICRESTEHLDLSHRDNLAGLGYARRCSDAVAALMLSGSAIVPMATIILNRGYGLASTGRWSGLVVIVLSSMALLSWLFFTLYIGLRSRLAISRALARLRDHTLKGIVSERQELRTLGVVSSLIRAYRKREETDALDLSTGLLFGSGAWQEILNFNLGIATAVVTTALQSWLAAPPH